MDVAELKKYCLAFPESTKKHSGEPANILSFSIFDKKFAYFKTSEPEKWRFSIRVTPKRFLELTDQTGIKPARYMHRFHWVSIVDVTSFDEDYLKTLIQWSYKKSLGSLPKKIQNQINNEKPH